MCHYLTAEYMTTSSSLSFIEYLIQTSVFTLLAMSILVMSNFQKANTRCNCT
uniref:Uncharacterized protein n=1 Tax=Arundo donax TaxID=35708 RepID=A0A0A9EK92_ARUDO